jgi:hypothetical protein
MDRWLDLAGIMAAFAVVYRAGGYAARLESLEAWREEMKTSLDKIHSAIREVRDFVREEHR